MNSIIEKKQQVNRICIVSCGTNDITNITIDSILRFHPNVEFFIIDACHGTSKEFVLAQDKPKKQFHIIQGVDRKSTLLPTIDVSSINYLSDNQKNIIKEKLGNPYTVRFRGSFNHCENIQLAIDVINDDFVLMDSDAPLIRPIDFVDSSFITICDEEIYTEEQMKHLKLLNNTFSRFLPFIQYLNVPLMKSNDVFYYNPNSLKDNLDIGMVEIWNDNSPSLFLDTGCIFEKQIKIKNLAWKKIDNTQYVDHFGAASYANKDSSEFIDKWMKILKGKYPQRSI